MIGVDIESEIRFTLVANGWVSHTVSTVLNLTGRIYACVGLSIKPKICLAFLTIFDVSNAFFTMFNLANSFITTIV